MAIRIENNRIKGSVIIAHTFKVDDKPYTSSDVVELDLSLEQLQSHLENASSWRVQRQNTVCRKAKDPAKTCNFKGSLNQYLTAPKRTVVVDVPSLSTDELWTRMTPEQQQAMIEKFGLNPLAPVVTEE